MLEISIKIEKIQFRFLCDRESNNLFYYTRVINFIKKPMLFGIHVKGCKRLSFSTHSVITSFRLIDSLLGKSSKVELLEANDH